MGSHNLEHIHDIIENFECFDDWEQRYGYLIDLGRSLPQLPGKDLLDSNKVDGCTSQVWLTFSYNADGTITFNSTSDAVIVKGLIYIILRIYNDRDPNAILEIDAESIFNQLELAEHLSPSRSNGFFAIVKKIKTIARALLKYPKKTS